MLLIDLRFPRHIRLAASLLGAMLLAWVARADTPPPYAGTLPEDYLPGLKAILETALRQSPQVLLHQIEISQNEARVYQADQMRWPNVGGDVRYDTNQTSVSGNSGTKSRDAGLFYSLSANQALFYWGEIKHRGEIARIEVAIAQKDYAEAYRMLAMDLRRTYLGLVARNAELRQRRFTLGLDETALKSAKESLDHGTISAADYAGRELRYNESQLEVDRKQAEFDAERRRLSRLAGLSDIPADQIPVEIPVPRYDAVMASQLLASVLRDGGKNAIPAQIADLHVKEADLNYQIARVRLLPKFGASLGHSRDSSTTATPTEVSQTAITRDSLEVRGSWTIFDGFATKGAKLEAKADKRYWDKERQIAADTAMDEAQRLGRAIELDARAVDYAEQHRHGAQAGVDLSQKEEKAGTYSASNVNDAVSNLRFAEANAAFARATYLSDWSAFVSLAAEDPALNHLPLRYVRASP